MCIWQVHLKIGKWVRHRWDGGSTPEGRPRRTASAYAAGDRKRQRMEWRACLRRHCQMPCIPTIGVRRVLQSRGRCTQCATCRKQRERKTAHGPVQGEACTYTGVAGARQRARMAWDERQQ